jgi:chromate reductase, NAD(P)H dehydrogenase (quinone)
MHLRQILSTIQVLVVPEQVAVPYAHKAFEGDELIDAIPRQLVAPLVRRVIQVATPAAPCSQDSPPASRTVAAG